MKYLSAEQISSHLALNLWRRSRPVLSIGFKDCLMYLYYNKNVSQIESSIMGRSRTFDSAIRYMNLKVYMNQKAKVNLTSLHMLLEGFQSMHFILTTDKPRQPGVGIFGSPLVLPLQHQTTIQRNSGTVDRSGYQLSESVDRVWLIGLILAFTDSLPCLGLVCLSFHLILILLSYINVHDLVHSHSVFTCAFAEQYVYPFYQS